MKESEQKQKPSYTLWQLVLYFLKLGTIGFGGPVALIGYMYRDLVESRKWMGESDYKDGLALAQLAPGPLAAQLSFYLGYVHYGVWGATAVGLAFVMPSFLMVLFLGWVYSLFGGLTWMQSVFYAVGASVIGIIAFSAYKLTTKTLGKDLLLWAIFAVVTVYTIITETEEILLFLGGGVVYWLVKAPPKYLQGRNLGLLGFAEPAQHLAAGAAATDSPALWNVFLIFAKAGAFVFGSGLAIVPFLYSGVVKEYHWLNDQQFIDAVAVAMITPGPVVITTGFIGYLIAGFSGAGLAAVATFIPAYLFTILPAPFFKKYGKRPAIAAFVTGVTAAATGAITGAVFVLGKRSIVDVTTCLLALLTLLLMWKGKKVSEPLIVLGSAVVGLIVYPFLH
ncbi:MAG: chromate transporter [Tumebacillaceae bacterium]